MMKSTNLADFSTKWIQDHASHSCFNYFSRKILFCDTFADSVQSGPDLQRHRGLGSSFKGRTFQTIFTNVSNAMGVMLRTFQSILYVQACTLPAGTYSRRYHRFDTGFLNNLQNPLVNHWSTTGQPPVNYWSTTALLAV